MNQIIELTEQQLFDYISCPVYFSLRYKNKYGIGNSVSMKSLLNQVVNGFCMKLIDGEVMSSYDMKRKWDMLTKKHPDIIDQKKNLQGISLLVQFWRWAANKEIMVVDVGSTYRLTFEPTDKKIFLTGMMGILTINKAKQIEQLIVDMSNKIPDQDRLDMSLKISLVHVAFKRLYKIPLLGTKILYAKTGKELYTTRDADVESKRLEKIVSNVAKSIEQNIWYPHESPLCACCRVKDFCRMWGYKI